MIISCINVGIVKTPTKKRPRGQRIRTRMHKMDDITKCGIRRHVHQFFFRNEVPTLRKMCHAINEDETLPKFSNSSLQRVLSDLGFLYAKRNRSSHLIERDDIIIWRRKYLRQIKAYRAQGFKIYYTDETWVNFGHTVMSAWQDSTIKSKRQAFQQGLSFGLKQPSGKGGRYILVHIGSDSGIPIYSKRTHPND